VRRWNNHLFDIVVRNTKNILNVYVNGTKVPSGTIYRNIVFHAHDIISIVYGKPPNIIPREYDFGSINYGYSIHHHCLIKRKETNNSYF